MRSDLVLCGIWFLAGMATTGFFTIHHRYYGPPVNPLTADERVQPMLTQRLVPMEIRLRIVPAEVFYSHMDSHVGAYTRDWESPCEIVVPDSYSINYFPAQAIADWAPHRMQWRGDLFLHEILHCIRGGWHP